MPTQTYPCDFSESGRTLKFPQVQSALARQGTRLPPTPAVVETHKQDPSPRKREPRDGAGGRARASAAEGDRPSSQVARVWVRKQPPGSPECIGKTTVRGRREIRGEEPSRQIIPNFILIDTNDPTICYASQRKETK